MSRQILGEAWSYNTLLTWDKSFSHPMWPGALGALQLMLLLAAGWLLIPLEPFYSQMQVALKLILLTAGLIPVLPGFLRRGTVSSNTQGEWGVKDDTGMTNVKDKILTQNWNTQLA